MNSADILVDPAEIETADLSQWLHETYHDDNKPPYFTETDPKAISELLLRLFHFRPSERPAGQDILLEPLFDER